MQSLFPISRSGAGGGFGGAREPIVLLSFKAGKCLMSQRQANNKFAVTPDLRRGKVELVKANDGLIHFRWVDRSSSRIEDDRIVFPDDLSYKKCKTGRENDRVYLLKFRGSNQPLMFWMQDLSAEKDNENAEKMNELANNPVAAAAAVTAATPTVTGPVGGLGGIPMPAIPGLTPEQWAQMLGLPAAAGAATSAPTAESPVPSSMPTTGAVPAPSTTSPTSSTAPPVDLGALGSLDFSSILGLAAAPSSGGQQSTSTT